MNAKQKVAKRKTIGKTEELKARPESLVVMAHDPGSRNYGWSCVKATRVRGGKIKVSVLENGLCPVPINQMKSGKTLREGLAAYKQWTLDLFTKYGVQFVVAERFMTRGGKGPTIEAVNMMLGALVLGDIPCKVLPAAQWKNALRRAEIDLAYWYKWAKVTPHQLDACLIGVYVCSMLYGFKGVDALDLKKRMKSLVLEIEKTSGERLINRQTRKKGG